MFWSRKQSLSRASPESTSCALQPFVCTGSAGFWSKSCPFVYGPSVDAALAKCGRFCLLPCACWSATYSFVDRDPYESHHPLDIAKAHPFYPTFLLFQLRPSYSFIRSIIARPFQLPDLALTDRHQSRYFSLSSQGLLPPSTGSAQRLRTKCCICASNHENPITSTLCITELRRSQGKARPYYDCCCLHAPF